MDKVALNKLYQYIAMKQKLGKANLILGLGSFDLRVAHHCAQLYVNGYADHLLFSGGVGNGSGNLNEPEAMAYKKIVLANYPEIAENKILTEPNSTNTGENIELTINELQKHNLYDKLQTVILVTSPVRQRRAHLTFTKHLPNIMLFSSPPKSDYNKDFKYYKNHGQDLDALIKDEMMKINKYPDLGYISETKIPESIKEIFFA